MEDGEKETKGRGWRGRKGGRDRRKGRIKNRRKEKEDIKKKKKYVFKMAFTNEYTLEKKYHKNVGLHFLKQKIVM